MVASACFYWGLDIVTSLGKRQYPDFYRLIRADNKPTIRMRHEE